MYIVKLPEEIKVNDFIEIRNSGTVHRVLSTYIGKNGKPHIALEGYGGISLGCFTGHCCVIGSWDTEKEKD